MITILRRIRQQLIKENQMKKYTLYAIGEILLVVIGILIALQINNWNESRKTRVVERQLLQEYQEELRFNSQNFSRIKNDFVDRMNSLDILLEAIEKNLPYVDSLSSHYGVLTTGLRNKLSRTTFHSLEAKGMDIISNSALKKSILELHIDHYGKLGNRIENLHSNVKEYGRPIIRKRLKAMGDLKYVPVNYDQLMNDLEVWNIIKTLRGNYFNAINIIQDEIQVKIKEVDQMITKELK